MKILNLYCGIGGNRKLWGDEHEVTAVEINSDIAGIYKGNFPQDNLIITDALTQICFGCGIVRTSLPEDALNVLDEVKHE